MPRQICMGKRKISLHGSELYPKSRKILPNRDQRFKGNSNLSNEHKYVPKGSGSFDFFYFKNGQNRDFLQFLNSEMTHCMPNTSLTKCLDEHCAVLDKKHKFSQLQPAPKNLR
jgi:hypothetical protein